MLAVSFLTAVPAADYYVSAKGSDNNSGSQKAPFATLERARHALRQARSSAPHTVWIRGGTYALSRTFQLSREDSSTAYQAWPGERVLITGGQVIRGFKLWRGQILRLDLRSLGIVNFGKLTPRGFGRPIKPAGLEFFFQDRPMTLARWPNLGWARIGAVPAGPAGGKFTYEGTRPARWTAAPDVWIHGYWTWDWADSYERVRAIDPERREISTDPPHGVYGYTTGRRFYALNLLEELDEPGEWYLDRATGVLYFWPPAPLDESTAWVSLLEDPLVSLRNTDSVTLRGLSFEYTRGAAVEILGGAHNLLAGCTVRNIGTVGVRIEGGADNGIADCDISETGDGGIILSGGDRRTLTPAGNYAVNNRIQDYSRWDRTYRPAIQPEGVGQRVAHNLIYNGPHTAILLQGNEHTIEYNDIHSVELETADVGAFYMGRDFTERGNIIRNNFFHNLGSGDVNGVYLDDCASGTVVSGNLFYRAGRAAFIGGGRDNTIEDNTFVDCNPAVHVDARGMNWARKWFDGEDHILIDRLKAVNYQQPPYSERYPQLVHLWEDEPAVPKGNVILRNTYFGKWLDLRDHLTSKIVKIEGNTENDGAGCPPCKPPDSGPKPAVDTGVIHTHLEVMNASTLRLVIENLGRTPASGTTALWITPAENGKFRGAPVLTWSLQPGESRSAEFSIKFAAGAKDVTVGYQRLGDSIAPIGKRMLVKP